MVNWATVGSVEYLHDSYRSIAEAVAVLSETANAVALYVFDAFEIVDVGDEVIVVFLLGFVG